MLTTNVPEAAKKFYVKDKSGVYMYKQRYVLLYDWILLFGNRFHNNQVIDRRNIYINAFYFESYIITVNTQFDISCIMV